MKKGCIIKSFFILILLLGIGYHLYNEYGREFIEESKEDFLSLDYEDILDELSNLSESDYSDSLKLVVTDLMERAESEDYEDSKEEIEETLSSIREYLEDHELDMEEYKEIKKLVEEYERSAKIRD